MALGVLVNGGDDFAGHVLAKLVDNVAQVTFERSVPLIQFFPNVSFDRTLNLFRHIRRHLYILHDRIFEHLNLMSKSGFQKQNLERDPVSGVVSQPLS